MITEVYSAFRKAGVPEEEATKAAEALSSESTATKSDVNKLDNKMSAMMREQAVMKWMLGIVIAAQVMPLLKSLN